MFSTGKWLNKKIDRFYHFLLFNLILKVKKLFTDHFNHVCLNKTSGIKKKYSDCNISLSEKYTLLKIRNTIINKLAF